MPDTFGIASVHSSCERKAVCEEIFNILSSLHFLDSLSSQVLMLLVHTKSDRGVQTQACFTLYSYTLHLDDHCWFWNILTSDTSPILLLNHQRGVCVCVYVCVCGGGFGLDPVQQSYNTV